MNSIPRRGTLDGLTVVGDIDECQECGSVFNQAYQGYYVDEMDLGPDPDGATGRLFKQESEKFGDATVAAGLCSGGGRSYIEGWPNTVVTGETPELLVVISLVDSSSSKAAPTMNMRFLYRECRLARGDQVWSLPGE